MKYKRITYNMISGLLSQAVAFILAFLIPRLFLVNFGSETKGLLSTITQIFSYLWLLEAGVGLATVQALYGPISKKDHASINAVMAATGHYYRRTGCLFLFCMLFFAALFSGLTDTELSRPMVFTLVLLQGIPTVLSYFVQGKYRLLLEAEGKSYILNNLSTSAQFIVNFGKAGLLYFTQNLLLVQSLSCFSTLFQLFFLLYYIRKNYPWLDLKNTVPDFSAISQKGSVLVHQISGVIFNNTDILLLSFFCGFRVVSVYTVYNSFFTYAEKFLTVLSSSFTFSLGQLFHKDKDKFLTCHNTYETCYLAFIFILYTLIFLFILPIVQIYTRGIHDINYIDPWLPVFFVTITLLSNGKMPSNQVIIFAEHFEVTKHHAIIEAIINLTLSTIAVWHFGIYGGLMGTIAALLYRGNQMIIYANRTILKRSPVITYRKWGIYLITFIIILLFFRPNYGELTTYTSIFLHAVPMGLFYTILYICAAFWAQPELFPQIMQFIKERN